MAKNNKNLQSKTKKFKEDYFGRSNKKITGRKRNSSPEDEKFERRLMKYHFKNLIFFEENV